jgi:NitT/TauT family transport system substrate-binding protein
MARKLTTFSKLLITLIIVAILFFGITYLRDNGFFGDMATNNTEEAGNSGSNTNSNTSNSGSTSSDDVIKVGVVTWGGYAGGQYFNEGFEATTKSRFYKDYGFKVEFQVLDDFDASRNAFKSGDVDLLWATIDAFPTEVGGLSDFDPVVVFQADWSRGGDAIVARRGITSVADLKGKKIAVAEMTPSHSFLIWLMEAGGLTVNDVEILGQPSAIDAAEVFKSGRCDAAVVWSPDDILSLKAVPGSRVLESSKSAAYIIADVFFAKRAFVDANKDRVRQLYEGWMKGAAEINSNTSSRKKAAAILSEEFTERGTPLTPEEADEMIGNVRLTTHGDNKNFFRLNSDYKGVAGDDLYRNMTDKYTDLKYIEGRVPAWRQVAYPSLVSSTTLTDPANFAEKSKSYTKATKADETKTALATKAVSISFRTGEFQLDDNAKYIIDKEFVDIAKVFNSRIRIEGNTDNVGSASSNKALSLKRANAVANYLITEHGMPRNRFIIVGNGPDKPVASNNTDKGRAKNRRTDFELIAE